MAKIKGYVEVNTERCKGCNLCVVACPSGVLDLQPREVNNHGYHYVYVKQPDDCIGCANCGYVCPDGCLTIYRKKVES
ncbi:MAG: 4Fe-4S dicluster domain-containing protein [Proteiniphilum sp.]|jgi:2-oxoglutarate ferredoxin oxidoreductase subunit delta|nr:4Fe-4S dicluster domain-containing protein [Proteiniphilum sp.]MDD4158705.1 4Fe-4S dicluster domain-containing protein [Proteiniphilum sp.]MDD4800461.1 4Fe-4S dicluster domain-containing protein [Proteiniphilum sp.]